MAKAKFSHVAIRGVCTEIPCGRVFLDDEKSYYPDGLREPWFVLGADGKQCENIMDKAGILS